MKRIAFTTICLVVLKTLAFAQLRTPTRTDDTNRSSEASPTNPSMLSTQESDEFSPLNNLPFFPGGPQALKACLQGPDVYSGQARLAGVEGRVRVRFRIMPTGHLTQLEVVESQGPWLDYAALEAVARLPPWYPAHRAGRAVSSLYELPITFRLD